MSNATKEEHQAFYDLADAVRTLPVKDLVFKVKSTISQYEKRRDLVHDTVTAQIQLEHRFTEIVNTLTRNGNAEISMSELRDAVAEWNAGSPTPEITLVEHEVVYQHVLKDKMPWCRKDTGVRMLRIYSRTCVDFRDGKRFIPMVQVEDFRLHQMSHREYLASVYFYMMCYCLDVLVRLDGPLRQLREERALLSNLCDDCELYL